MGIQFERIAAVLADQVYDIVVCGWIHVVGNRMIGLEDVPPTTARAEFAQHFGTYFLAVIGFQDMHVDIAIKRQAAGKLRVIPASEAKWLGRFPKKTKSRWAQHSPMICQSRTMMVPMRNPACLQVM